MKNSHSVVCALSTVTWCLFVDVEILEVEISKIYSFEVKLNQPSQFIIKTYTSSILTMEKLSVQLKQFLPQDFTHYVET